MPADELINEKNSGHVKETELRLNRRKKILQESELLPNRAKESKNIIKFNEGILEEAELEILG